MKAAEIAGSRWVVVCTWPMTDMAHSYQAGHGRFSQICAWLECSFEGGLGIAPDGQRDARQLQATMDHTDIRGLVTALHRFVAGLPRPRVGDHPVRDAHIVISRIPLTVCRASRCRSGVRRLLHGSVLRLRLSGDRSGDCAYLLANAPDKARQLPCDRDANLVVLPPPGRELPVAVIETQLRTPSDGAHGGGLLFLALLQWRAVSCMVCLLCSV